MTPQQVELILEIIDLKIQLLGETNCHDHCGVLDQIECRERDLRSTAEDEE